ncbi:preprotein translocase subunit YajC [Buchnera aphidicola (Aphis craccivora)]|uniref:Sec translocon accessory complex subunit YajC n=1 Tax=Buchnera aphidicola (Aphis craccivora) TaxID=466616 RepID=A0A4D6XU24_9GAMM|nr:preprotein translocase subunit YajC [Buchnera aphidicola]QCI16395.1 preprotein translocase subunit YajC [Buchnera aphidicola (Aphis craccivora)]QLL40536.1 preprotein translocase subunit YajC [Buchnera aphidicola (Aphis craccivore)]WAI17906.1 MAG: preprotein translocase subunit YajC [Buchnera aphidicola (Aphis craccivora)]
MNFLIENAYATLSQPTENNSYSLVVMLVIFLLIFYFMLFRPQQKKEKERKNLMKLISLGDEVMTNSGFLGRVKNITENGYILLELNNTNEVFIKKDFIISLLPKNTLESLKKVNNKNS